jgi:hypothetical protein
MGTAAAVSWRSSHVRRDKGRFWLARVQVSIRSASMGQHRKHFKTTSNIGLTLSRSYRTIFGRLIDTI